MVSTSLSSWIGMSCNEDQKQRIYSSPYSLAQAVSWAGGIPVLLPSAIGLQSIPKLLARCSGIVIAGGAYDLPPALYGERKRHRIDLPQRERIRFEFELIRQCLKMRKPLLGICGGMQSLNVVLGGTLYQDLPSEIPSEIVHEQKIPKHKPSHRITLQKDSLLFRWLGKQGIFVNSTHHQAVKALGKGLQAVAHAPDGVIEAIEGPGGTLTLGVQWHPEVLVDAASKKFWKSFIEACQSSAPRSRRNRKEDRSRSPRR